MTTQSPSQALVLQSSRAELSERQRVILPTLLAEAGEDACKAFLEYFTAQIENPNTRMAYLRAVLGFMGWADDQGLELGRIQPWDTASYFQQLKKHRAKSTVKQHLAAVRTFFDFLVVRQVVRFNPASSVKGPKLVVHKGSTPVLWEEDLAQLFASFDTSRIVGLRDRAIVSVMLYAFARAGAVVKMRVRDFRSEGYFPSFLFHEKGGVQNEVSAHPDAVEYLNTYVEAADITDERDGPLFRSIGGRGRPLTNRPLDRRNIHEMVKRRLRDAGLTREGTCHSFRASGISIFLKNGGSLEDARKIAGHASARTTQVYDHSDVRVGLAEVMRVKIPRYR